MSIKIQGSKLKFRKGRNFGWKTIPKEIQDTLVAQHTELIQDVGEGRTYWQAMTGEKEANTTTAAVAPPAPATRIEEETSVSGNLTNCPV